MGGGDNVLSNLLDTFISIYYLHKPHHNAPLYILLPYHFFFFFFLNIFLLINSSLYSAFHEPYTLLSLHTIGLYILLTFFTFSQD